MRRVMINPGDRYGDLTVIGRAGASDHGDAIYQCQCRCGNMCLKKATVLKMVSTRGNICSCGCRRKERRVKK